MKKQPTKQTEVPIIEVTLPRKFTSKDSGGMKAYLKQLFYVAPSTKALQLKHVKAFQSPGFESRAYSTQKGHTIMAVRAKEAGAKIQVFELPQKNISNIEQSFDLLKSMNKKSKCRTSLSVSPTNGVFVTVASF